MQVCENESENDPRVVVFNAGLQQIFTFYKMDPIKLSISDYVNILQQNVRRQEYTKHFDEYLCKKDVLLIAQSQFCAITSYCTIPLIFDIYKF